MMTLWGSKEQVLGLYFQFIASLPQLKADVMSLQILY